MTGPPSVSDAPLERRYNQQVVNPVAEGTVLFAVVGHRGAAVVELAYGIPYSRAHCRSRTLGRCRLGASEEGVNFLLRENFMLRSVLPPKIVVE